MNIALFVPGGVDQSARRRVIPALLALIERLASQHNVWVIAINQYPDYRRYALLGAEVINLGAPALGIMPGVMSRFCKVRSLLKEEKLQWDILHAFWVGPCSNLALALGFWLRLPVIVSVGGGESVWFEDIAYGGCGNWRGKLLLSLALKYAAAVTVGSDYLKHTLPTATRLYRVPLGVDSGYWRGGETISRPAPPWRLLHIASINRVKDPDILLQALRLLVKRGEPVVLDWFGEDTLNGAIQRKADTAGLNGIVRFHGLIENRSLFAFYHRAHLLVQSSRHESQGIAVCEAAAMGVPTVGTAVGLVADLAPEAALATPVQDPAGKRTASAREYPSGSR